MNFASYTFCINFLYLNFSVSKKLHNRGILKNYIRDERQILIVIYKLIILILNILYLLKNRYINVRNRNINY